MITEDVLHYIWKYQKFSTKRLFSSDGKRISVIQTGFHNHDSGPDFEEARILMDEIEWVGSVEIHIRSSDWQRHKHSLDPAYKNVVLHVVFTHDQEIMIDNLPVATLELKNHIEPDLIQSCQSILFSRERIPCGTQLQPNLEMAYKSMLDKVLVERLEKKASTILAILKSEKNDWEEACYHVLAANFGFSINKRPFQLLAKRLPYSILKKELDVNMRTEALLMGHAGFLGKPAGSYQKKLQSEYLFLAKKYHLTNPLKKNEWKFGKMRPGNFPIIRVAQFASFLCTHPRVFSMIIETQDPEKLINTLQFEMTDYWKHHYDFGKPRKRKSSQMGLASFQNILINTVAPLLAAYGEYTSNQDFLTRAIGILEQLPAEHNRVTKEWARINKKPQTAFDSQAQIQLFNEFCSKRKCLSCSIGVSLLQRD